MRLLIIRHADPDYEHDTLTETGWREAGLLARRLEREQMDHIYVSPLGRAQDTAGETLKLLRREAVTLDWLREFPPLICRPDDPGERHIVWDWLPGDWTREDRFYDVETWLDAPAMSTGDVREQYLLVTRSLDGLLARHGYRRNGRIYAAERPNHETLALFCHFGVECVILSRLLNVSPMILWHGFAAAPSSVTTVYTEERREGVASFRTASFGDVSHLYAAGEGPSFHARFCECFSDDTRHD